MKIKSLKKWHQILIVGTLAVVIVATMAERYTYSQKKVQAFSQINLFLELRHSILIDFLKSMGTEVRSASTNHVVPGSMEALSTQWMKLTANERTSLSQMLYLRNASPNLGKVSPSQVNYLKNHQLFETYTTRFIEHFGYYDIFLISPEGDVVYSYAKEKDFGTNLSRGEYNSSALAEVYHRAMKVSLDDIKQNREGLIFSDFEAYAPSNGEPAAFCAYPILKGGKTIGVLALQIPTEYLNNMMKFSAGMGKTGETYLVGHDKLMRSQSRFTKTQTALKRLVDTPPVRLGLEGKKGVISTKDYRDTPVFSAYNPIDFGGHAWVVLAEIDEKEIMGNMHNWTLFISAIGIGVVAFVALMYRRNANKTT